MSTKKSKQKNKTFGEKLFGRFSKKKSQKDKKDKKDKKENKRNGKTKAKYDKRTNYNASKPHKIIDVTPAVPTELKDKYTIDDVINYRSQVIRSVNAKKRKTLVTEKLRLCSVSFDFTQIMDEMKSNNDAQQLVSERRKMDGINANILNGMRPSRILSKQELDRKKEITVGIDKKRQMLVEIVEFISTQKWWDEDILKELIDCVTANLFRTLPLGSKRKFVKGDEEEEPFLDPQWLHLQLVYELCLRFLISNDIDKKVMQKYLHGAFVLNIIQLFQSEDLRERDYLKTILHRIYGRFMPLRQQIRTEIANECFRYVYSDSRGVHGIAEFLDIFSSIINGFSIPVKEEHKAFLRNVLLPLHKCNKYEVYFQQLADCCVLFVNKEQSIATTVLAGLLKFWPTLSPTKQAFYLREMLNVIGALVEHENGFSYPKYKDIVLLCVDKIFESMESPHFQVADQALSLWKDTVMLYLSKCQKDMIWRRLFIIFKDIELNHWNSGIQHLSNEVVLYYLRIDYEYWKKLEDEYEKTSKSTADGENTETHANGNENTSKQISDRPETRKQSTHKIPVIVPNTLVPGRYQSAKQNKIDNRQTQRVSKWKQIRETAEHNKQIMDKIKAIEMNGFIEAPDLEHRDTDHNVRNTITQLLDLESETIRSNNNDEEEEENHNNEDVIVDVTQSNDVVQTGEITSNNETVQDNDNPWNVVTDTAEKEKTETIVENAENKENTEAVETVQKAENKENAEAAETVETTEDVTVTQSNDETIESKEIENDKEEAPNDATTDDITTTATEDKEDINVNAITAAPNKTDTNIEEVEDEPNEAIIDAESKEKEEMKDTNEEQKEENTESIETDKTDDNVNIDENNKENEDNEQENTETEETQTNDETNPEEKEKEDKADEELKPNEDNKDITENKTDTENNEDETDKIQEEQAVNVNDDNNDNETANDKEEDETAT